MLLHRASKIRANSKSRPPQALDHYNEDVAQLKGSKHRQISKFNPKLIFCYRDFGAQTPWLYVATPKTPSIDTITYDTHVRTITTHCMSHSHSHYSYNKCLLSNRTHSSSASIFVSQTIFRKLSRSSQPSHYPDPQCRSHRH